jgi:hypothetical protein
VFAAALPLPYLVDTLLAWTLRHPEWTGLAFLTITLLDWIGRLLTVVGATFWLAHAARAADAGGTDVLIRYCVIAGVVLVVCVVAVVSWHRGVQAFELAISAVPAGLVVLAGVGAHHRVGFIAFPLLALGIAALVLAINMVVWGIFRRAATAARRSWS